MNKTIENLSSVIREIAAQEAEKHTDIVIGEIAEKNSDGTYDVFIVPDFVTPVTNIPNSSIYDFNIGEGCYVRKYNNQLQSSAIVDKIGFSQPRFGTGGEGSSSASGSLVAGKTSELQNDGSDGVHPFIDTSALLQTSPIFYPSTSEDKIFSAKAVSGAFTYLTEQVAEALDTKVAVNEKQDFTDSQKRTARTNIGAASQEDIEGINSNIANCVQVNAQAFTEEQKTQARTNINAACATYGAIGDGATTTTGGAVGNNAIATSGGAIGFQAKETSGGGAVGYEAGATTGGALGNNAKETYGGGAVGINTSASRGFAGGRGTTAVDGGAVGWGATADTGGAVGSGAEVTGGGSVGNGAMTGNGFAGGYLAKTVDSSGNKIDAIQLGEGTNNTPKTLQVYNYKVYDFNKDSLYCQLLNDKTPAVIETVWSGGLMNDGSTTITVSAYSQYDYFILYGSVYGQFCNIISNTNGTYSFTKKSESDPYIMAFSFVYTNGSFTWGESGYYANGNFTFVDKTGTSSYVLYKIEGVKICKV